MDRRTRTRLHPLLLAATALLPWAVVAWSDGFYLVFAVGSTSRGLSGFVPLTRAPPVGAFLAWPLATATYVLAVCSSVLDATGHGDRRVTAGLLVLAGLDVLWFTLGIGSQRGIVVVPTGTVVFLAAAAFEYRAILADRTRRALQIRS